MATWPSGATRPRKKKKVRITNKTKFKKKKEDGDKAIKMDMFMLANAACNNYTATVDILKCPISFSRFTKKRIIRTTFSQLATEKIQSAPDMPTLIVSALHRKETL